MSYGDYRYCPKCQRRIYVDHVNESLVLSAGCAKKATTVTLMCGHQLIEEQPVVSAHVNAVGLHPPMPWDTGGAA